MNVETNRAAGSLLARTAQVLRRPRRIHLPSLRLRVSERRLMLFLMDILLLNSALVVAVDLWTNLSLSPATFLLYARWFFTLTLIWLFCALFFDCYNLARAASTMHSVRSVGAAAAITALVYTLTPFLTPPLYSRGLIFLFAGMAIGAIVLWRVFYAQLFAQPWFKQRALVVGAGWAGRYLAAALRTAPVEANPFRGTGYELVGFVDDNPDYAEARVEGVPVLGGREELVSLAQSLEVDEVILAITHRHAIAPELFAALLRCRELGLRVTTMSTLYERLLGRVPIDHVGRDLQVVVQMEDSAGERLYSVAKRGFDLIFALLGLAAMGLLLPFIALANALFSPGPLFYRQKRVGRTGHTFDLLKFRSMVPNAEQETGPVWASDRDPRVTPLGRLLRRTRLDELPQFLNILRGDMSLIGPRPERPEFVEQLESELPFYRARHAVRPGLTGWAQVRYTYGNCIQDARVKLEYDLYYVKHAGFYLDLLIMLQTIPVMLQFKGN